MLSACTRALLRSSSSSSFLSARAAAATATIIATTARRMHPRRAASPTATAAGSSSPKRAKMATAAAATPAAAEAPAAAAQKIVIGTHSGTFHCDEALGCWMLRRTAALAGARVVRTRDAEVLATLPIVIDVGGSYDPSAGRLDHHQRGFAETFGHGHDAVKLSSAGLVYKHHGREVVRALMAGAEGCEAAARDDAAVERVYLRVYQTFILAVDAVDNGVEPFRAAGGGGGGALGPPLYHDGTTLGARVSRLNPEWNAPPEAQTAAALDAAFEQAVALAGGEFADAVVRAARSWLPAKEIVERSVASRLDADPSGRIVRLAAFAPWKEHLYDLEEELLGICGGAGAAGADTAANGKGGGGDDPRTILYVLYEDDREHTWRVQCVAKGPGSFESRLPMPEPWRGLRGAALGEASGAAGCVFCHASGFIGGNETYEGALDMARRSLAAGTAAAAAMAE